jgi:CyaY protein
VIVNLQPPKHEIWLAAKAGGFHYKYVDGQWRDTRDNSEFFAALSQHSTAQAGEPVNFKA